MSNSNNIEESSFRINQNDKLNGRWTSEEHELFLEGLQLYGRNWKRISNVVKSRTGSQVRSHAQKYFNRLSNKKKEDLNEGQSEISHCFDGKMEQSDITTLEINHENSESQKINQMLEGLKNTLSLIQKSKINPLTMFSHYFFQIMKNPQHLINNNFFSHFIQISQVREGSVWSQDSQQLIPSNSNKVSFRPFVNLQQCGSNMKMQQRN